MKSLYFSHDYNASDDHKILFLRQQLGMEGVGIYWYIIERLAQAGGKLPLRIAPVLAMQMQVTESKVNTVISNYELFTVEEKEFFSQRLSNFISVYVRTRELQSAGGAAAMKKRWAPKKSDKQNPNDFV